MIGASVGPQGQAPLHAIESSWIGCTFFTAASIPFFAQQLFVATTTRVAQQPVFAPVVAPFAQQQRPAARDSGEQRQASFAELAFACGPKPVGSPRFITIYITNTKARQRLRRVIPRRTSTNIPRTRSVWCRSVINERRAIMIWGLGKESTGRNDLTINARGFNLAMVRGPCQQPFFLISCISVRMIIRASRCVESSVRTITIRLSISMKMEKRDVP
ncbi:MAG: hypothetical protein JWP89_5604 [Schlesneria sp.]|nr:hypothetical protein [Schlesneria sp.]